jgi:hypothetical protein
MFVTDPTHPRRHFDIPLIAAVLTAAAVTGLLANLYHGQKLESVRGEIGAAVHAARTETEIRTSENGSKISELKGEVVALEGALSRLSQRLSDAIASRDLALRVGQLEGVLGLDRSRTPPSVPVPPSSDSVPPPR